MVAFELVDDERWIILLSYILKLDRIIWLFSQLGVKF